MYWPDLGKVQEIGDMNIVSQMCAIAVMFVIMYFYIYIYININFLFHPLPSRGGGVAEFWTVSVSVSASVHFRLLTQAKIWWYRKYFVIL